MEYLTPRMGNRLQALEVAAERVNDALKGADPLSFASAQRDWISRCRDIGQVARAEGLHGLAAAMESITRYPL